MGWSDSVHKSRVSSSFLQVLNQHAQRSVEKDGQAVKWKRGRLSLIVCAAALLFISRRFRPSRSLQESGERLLQLTNDSLADLLNILESLRYQAQVVVDLGGRVLSASLAGASPIVLDRSHEGLTMRNGSLELWPSRGLVLRDSSVRLENVHIFALRGKEEDSDSGASPSKTSLSKMSPSKLTEGALLRVVGGDLAMEQCSISGGSEAAIPCRSLVVEGGAGVQLLGCSVSRSSLDFSDTSSGSDSVVEQTNPQADSYPSGPHAVIVRGTGSHLVSSSESTLCGEGGCALLVSMGGSAELSGGCVLSAPWGSHGLAVVDEGSRAVVDACVIDGCGGTNVHVSAGGSALLTACSLSCSRASGLHVQGARSCVVAKYCKLEGNKEDCLVVTEGGAVDLDGCCMMGSAHGCGATLSGDASELTASNCSFKGNAACNLQAEGGARLTLADCMLTGAQQFHGLSLSGEGTKVAARSCNFGTNELCNVHVDGGASGEFAECNMSDSRKFTGMAVGGKGSLVSAIDCVFDGNMKSNVSVYAAANVDLIGCVMRRAQELHGLVVKDEGSLVTALDCSLEGNEEVNAYVFDGAKAEFTSCSLAASRSSKGLVVKGSGCSVHVNGCSIQANDEANVYVCAGAEATFEGCAVTAAKRLHGMVVSDPGSWVKARECSFTSNAQIGVLAMAGGRLELSACSVLDNPEASVMAEDEGSQAMVDNTTELDTDVVCNYGGRIQRRS